MAVKRSPTNYDDDKHVYSDESGRLLGISSVAKVGGGLEAFGIGAAWGYRIGYEGAHDLMVHDHPNGLWVGTKDELRAELKRLKLTPWSKRDSAAQRGNWVHDVLEALAQDHEVPNLSDYPEEVQGYIQSVLRWYAQEQPGFVATEVQVVSNEHRFAGRYDIRAYLDIYDDEGELALIDLKTTKRVYPEQHYPQLAGYELASVEMGFPATEAQYVLHATPDGKAATLHKSTATAQDFLNYKAAYESIQRLTPPRRR